MYGLLFNPPPPSIKDDRGVEHTVEPALIDEAVESEAGRTTFGWRQWLLSATMLAALVHLLWAFFRGNSPADNALRMFVLASMVFANVHWSRQYRLQRHVRALATLIANGRCGCCGYRLNTQPPGLDGFCVCPECGAAWHYARLAQLHQPGSVPGDFQSEPFRDAYRSAVKDDRGVITRMITPLGPERTSRPSLPERQRMLRERLAQRRRPFLAMVTMGFCVAGVVGIGFASVFASGAGQIVSWALVAAACVGGLVMAVWISQPGWGTRRKEALAMGWCPVCLSPLARSEPGFDGCAVCTECRRAWLSKDIGPVVAPPSPRVLCVGCGYDRTGLSICPECGLSSTGKPAPRSRIPTCARCSTQLPGPDRACPRCGVMAGVSWE